MKKFVATALVALAALGTPLAIGQSQGLRIDDVGELATGAVQAVQTSASALRVPGLGSSGGLDDPASVSPSPAVAWLMALGFLGLVVIRRTRSSFMR